VKAKLFDQLPDKTWVYPGHGKDTTIGAERLHVEEWRERAGKPSSPGVRPAQFRAAQFRAGKGPEPVPGTEPSRLRLARVGRRCRCRSPMA
jgi:glyoxylase-like metal-dependent hydrolase (beta-lactamase superfamily II)